MKQLIAIFSLVAAPVLAAEDAFTTGPVFEEFGPNAEVDVTWEVPDGTLFKHSFDVSKRDENGGPNRTLMSAARFINMHVRSGVAERDISLAVVVHGQAVKDVSAAPEGDENPSAALVAALVSKGVQIIVCGQSAAYYDVATEDLLPGVDMALSAMTAHAVLQQEGYTLNPF